MMAVTKTDTVQGRVLVPRGFSLSRVPIRGLFHMNHPGYESNMRPVVRLGDAPRPRS